jgi:hypothetical protein
MPKYNDGAYFQVVEEEMVVGETKDELFHAEAERD